MLEELLSEMDTQGRKFTFLCGHDSTVASVLAALGTEDYVLPGAIEPSTPIGVKVVFARGVNAEGAAFYRVSLVYQSAEQLRSIQPLSLNTPPMIVPLHFKGVTENADGMIPESELEGLLKEKINLYYQRIDFYEAEELQKAA